MNDLNLVSLEECDIKQNEQSRSTRRHDGMALLSKELQIRFQRITLRI